MLGKGLNEVLGGDVLNGGSDGVNKGKVLLKGGQNVVLLTSILMLFNNRVFYQS